MVRPMNFPQRRKRNPKNEAVRDVMGLEKVLFFNVEKFGKDD
jgi:hypothetical protein